MHHVAEYGIAAHWKYKSGANAKEEIDEKLRWISQLLEADDSTRDPDEFLHSFKTDIFQDETFVFTPKGDVISLPQGATVIDFAYAIHSAVGNKMIGAKINGMIVPIDRVPQNGEIVEIITSNASKGPSRDWLKIVRTSEARNKIRSWFKKEQRAENIEFGRAEIEKELRRYGRPFTDAERTEVVEAVAKRVGVQGADDLYNTVGFGGLSISRLATRLKDEFEKIVKAIEPEEPEELKIRTVEAPRNLKRKSGIIIDGEYGCEVKFAKCCNPLPGDEIIGFVTKGYGISVHKCDCPNVISGKSKTENDERWVDARWESDAGILGTADLFEANLQIFVRDEIGVLASITKALADMKVSIMSISSSQKSDGSVTIINLKVGCKNVGHFHSIVSKLKTVQSVESVSRGFGA
jgi:GTP pyrophosphokinase